jgi:DNA-binding transcriptional LysR family regulator
MVREFIEADDLHAMLSLVGHGLGVALLPMTEAILPLSPQVRTVSLAAAGLTREIGILSLPDDNPATDFLKVCLFEACT